MYICRELFHLCDYEPPIWVETLKSLLQVDTLSHLFVIMRRERFMGKLINVMWYLKRWIRSTESAFPFTVV